ncbi:MAG: response regulator [Syntrophobacterales bacterium]
MSIKDILIVDDDSLVCESLREMLTLEGYKVDTALNATNALGKMKETRFPLILSDIQMPGMNGLDLLKEIKGLNSESLVVFITGHGHIDGAVEAIKLGAYDYITKPIDDLRLKITIQRALEQSKLLASYESLKKCLKPWHLQDTLLFRDRKMEQLMELVHTIADTQATVLITGESGTGKSILAPQSPGKTFTSPAGKDHRAGGRQHSHPHGRARYYRHQHLFEGRSGQAQLPGRPLLPHQRGLLEYPTPEGAPVRHRPPGGALHQAVQSGAQTKDPGHLQKRPANLPPLCLAGKRPRAGKCR